MEFIAIDVDTFHRCFTEVDATDADTDAYAYLQKPIEDLKRRFVCLTTNVTRFSGHHHGHGNDNESRGGGGRYHHRRGDGGAPHRIGHGGHHCHGGHGNRRAERPRIGVRELSREDISRKDFIANMNKLSRQNYDSILRLIRTTYNSNFLQNYMDILWEMMLRQPDFQDLHIQVVQHLMNITPPDKKALVSGYWSDRCKAYFERKEWTPPEECFATHSPSDEYDEFCDYIKWKKKTGASLLAWLRLMDAEVIPTHYDLCFASIQDSIQEARQQEQFKYFDCLLEWFLQMVKFGIATYEFNDNIVFIMNDWLETIKQYGLSSSLRFKVMDIRELIVSKSQSQPHRHKK